MLEDDLYAKSNSSIIQDLGMRVRDYRLKARLTQEELAEKAGVSSLTLKKFETGKSTNINMSSFVAILRALQQLESINNILPELPLPPTILRQYQQNKPKRIRHGK